MIDAFANGALNWVDLSTPDIAGAVGFYRDLFSWTVEKMSTPMGEYFVGSVGGREVAGLMQQDPGMRGNPAVWTTFFFVESMEETIARVEGSNGRVLQPPFDIPGDARVAVIADPTGAMSALITGPKPGGVYLSRDPGAVCWVELLTRDPAVAERFYAALFAWEVATEQTGETSYTLFKLEGRAAAGMMLMPEEVPAAAPAHWAVYFAVADCAATVQRAVALGGRVLPPVTNVTVGRFAVLADPQGATFQLLEHTG